MKTDRSIGKPVIAVALVAMALLVMLVWMRSRAQAHNPGETPPPTPTPTPATPRPPKPPAPAPPSRDPATPTPAPAAEPAIASGPANPGLPPVVPVPLKPVLIDAENGSWLKDADYLRAPHAAREFGGVEFLMDGMVQLQSHQSVERSRSYRTQIVVPLTQTNVVGGRAQIVQHGSNVASLHLLGGSRYEEVPGAAFAQVVWRYADGSSRNVPLQYAVHLRDWVRNPAEQPARLPNLFSKVVWVDSSQPAHVLRLYRLTLANPAREKTVQSIEFTSSMTE